VDATPTLQLVSYHYYVYTFISQRIDISKCLKTQETHKSDHCCEIQLYENTFQADFFV